MRTAIATLAVGAIGVCIYAAVKKIPQSQKNDMKYVATCLTGIRFYKGPM